MADGEGGWRRLGRMQDKSVSQWNDVKFFPFSNLAPALQDMKGVAAVCGMNKIKILKIDLITERLNPLYEISDRSNLITAGPAEVFHTLSWSVDPLSLQPIIAAAGLRGVIKIFNARTGSELGMLYGHGGAIFGLAFSPIYPHVLASASSDHTVRIWNTTLVLKPTQTRPGREPDALHPRWDNPAGQLVTILAGVGGHRAPVCSLAWHAVHPLLASGGMDNEVKIWFLHQLPGIPADSVLRGTPGGSQDTDPPPVHPAPITKLPIFSTKHLHSHWVDQLMWASRSSGVIVSKAMVIGRESQHPFAKYASDRCLRPASEVQVWQASVLEEIFAKEGLSGPGAPGMEADEADAGVGGLDFDLLGSFQVAKCALSAEEESVEWGLGMCLSRRRAEGQQTLDLVILVGNHPCGVAEMAFSTLERGLDQPPLTVHPSVPSPPLPANADAPAETPSPSVFRAIDTTELIINHDSWALSFLFLLRVGRNGCIELWKHPQHLLVQHKCHPTPPRPSLHNTCGPIFF